MQTIATLGPSLRLVVLQFLVPDTIRPSVVPPKGPDKNPTTATTPPQSSGGVEVLKSNSGVYLLNLLDGICPITEDGHYELVDSWFVPAMKHFGKSSVRYVLCRKEHVKPGELNPNFLANRDRLIDSLVNLVDENLWTVQGHLNPYFERGGSPTDYKVLMLGCAGRQTTVDLVGNSIKVYRDGRDENNQGLGPKVPMRERAFRLQVFGDDIVLVAPTKSEPISASLADANIS